MPQQDKTPQQKVLKIIEDDFDGCEWFIISANELMQTLNESMELCRKQETTLHNIKDFIGKIGVGIENVQRCLDAVEDCYSKTVELLSREFKGKGG